MRCRGFRFAGVGCGIKTSGASDLAVIACDGPAAAAAVFTQNRVAAAPVLLSRRALKKSGGVVRAIVVNSGNANACTGKDGARDAAAMQKQLAQRLGTEPHEVLVASTGVIGTALPMDRVAAGIDAAFASLEPSGFARFAAAILTTDKSVKLAKRVVRIDGNAVNLIGCTKGAGMIAPNMATTLTFVATDIGATGAALSPLLGAACAETFNAIAVDGDTSTNDMIAVLASGATGVRLRRGKSAAALGEALTDLLSELATKLMRDGEGVGHVAKVVVRGAATRDAARAVARTIAVSPLVKTAIAGCDPNWGRILCAAGNAGVPISGARLALDIGEVAVVRGGVVVDGWSSVEARAAHVMSQREYSITLDLGKGAASAHYLACDLTHEYVSINADYRS